MHTFLPLTLLFASLPLIHAAPKGFKTRSFTDTHGSGLEIYPGRKRAVIPAQATALPSAPIAYAPIPTNIPAGSKREADASIEFNIPIPAIAISSSPQPTAAAAVVKRDADANAEPDDIHPLFFNPMPDFKAEGSGETKRDAEAEADAEAQVIPALNFPPMPAHKLDDGSSVKREAEADAEAQVLPAALNFPPMPAHKLDDSSSVKREAEAEAEAAPDMVFTANVPIPTFALGN